MKRIKQIDTEILIYLNNLGSETWDPLWIAITNKFTFIPIFILLIYLLYKKNGINGLLIILFFIALLILFTDQFTNLVKDSTQRLRPCRIDDLQNLLRDINIRCGKYGFFSAHASNSFSLAIFFGLLLRSSNKLLILLFAIYAFLISYSRIYLGVHYPIDILVGAIFGTINAIALYKIYLYSFNFLNKS